MQDKFTEEEYNELKANMERVKTHLPLDLTGYVWNSYRKIANTYEGQPCSCPSSAGLWIKATNTINDYIKENG